MEEVAASCPSRSVNAGGTIKLRSVVASFLEFGAVDGSIGDDSIGLHRKEILSTRGFICSRLIPIFSQRENTSHDRFIGLSGRRTSVPLDIYLRQKYTASQRFRPDGRFYPCARPK